MIKKIYPELNVLTTIAKKTVQETQKQADKILKSNEKPAKIIGQEIGRLVSQGPDKFVKTVEEVREPILSIAEKTVDAIKEKQDPISGKISELIEKYSVINPVNVVKNTENVVKTYTDVISKNVDVVGAEITKTVVKEKTTKIIKTTFKDRFIKFINWFKNLFKIGNKS